VSLALVAALALSAAPSDAPFERLKSLVGDWEAKTAKGTVVRLNYKLVSNGSVLVQTYQPGPRETLTVMHADGKRVLATHYCAQGNQPRLALSSSTETSFVFTFVDATNLAAPGDSHLVRLQLELESPTALTQTETYEENGKPDVTTLRFTRTR
jgi:hypothetical protein